MWSADGTELFYVDASGTRVMSVSSPADETSSFGEPQVVANGEFVAGVAGHRMLDVAPDGERLVAIAAGDVSETSNVATAPGIVVVENWLEELKRLVPVP